MTQSKNFNGIPFTSIQRGVGHTIIDSDLYLASQLIEAIKNGKSEYMYTVGVLKNHGHYGGITNEVRERFGETECVFTFDLSNASDSLEKLESVIKKASKY